MDKAKPDWCKDNQCTTLHHTVLTFRGKMKEQPMTVERPLVALANYWREQANIWREQEKAWHEVALFCRQSKEELGRKMEERRRAS